MANTAVSFGDSSDTQSTQPSNLPALESFLDPSIRAAIAEKVTGTAARNRASTIRTYWIAEPVALTLREPMVLPNNRVESVQQEWEAVVTSIGAEEFTAELRDLTSPASSPEEADFSIDDVSDCDRHLLVEGAIFRWMIGYCGALNGPSRRFSHLVFRQLPGWTKRNLDAARSKGEELARSIRWE